MPKNYKILIFKLKEWFMSVLPQRLHPMAFAEARVWSAKQGRVIAGPFAGMDYIKSSICSALAPKILGTYELELHDKIEEICSLGFRTIIDVGAAEGYYAVGFALRCPDARIVAFESDAQGRALVRSLSAKNGTLERVEVKGHCTRELLRQELKKAGGAAIVMDIEGGEIELLQPDLIPELANSLILVELHEFIFTGVGAVIASRFSATHSIIEISTADRLLKDLPLRSRFLDRWLLKLMREFRPGPMSWYMLVPVAIMDQTQRRAGF